MCICVGVYVNCVCLCVCVWERERARERERKGDGDIRPIWSELYSSVPSFSYWFSLWMILPWLKMGYWSHNIIVFVYIILFKSVNICLIYLAAPVLDNIYLQYDGQFIHLISCLSLSYNAFFVSCEFILPDISKATSAVLWLSFVWNIFFHPFTFSLYLSLKLNVSL